MYMTFISLLIEYVQLIDFINDIRSTKTEWKWESRLRNKAVMKILGDSVSICEACQHFEEKERSNDRILSQLN